MGLKESTWNTGKGAIVDSGTTDTYLPRTAAAAFKKEFKKITGRDYGNVKMTLSDKDFAAFPTLGFVFKDSKGETVVIHVSPSAYLEHQGSNRYVPRIYLTEGSGSVLGANFMQVRRLGCSVSGSLRCELTPCCCLFSQDHNVMFDEENQRVGFARADCSYERFVEKQKEAAIAEGGGAPPAEVTASPAADPWGDSVVSAAIGAEASGSSRLSGQADNALSSSETTGQTLHERGGMLGLVTRWGGMALMSAGVLVIAGAKLGRHSDITAIDTETMAM